MQTTVIFSKMYLDKGIAFSNISEYFMKGCDIVCFRTCFFYSKYLPVKLDHSELFNISVKFGFS